MHAISLAFPLSSWQTELCEVNSRYEVNCRYRGKFSNAGRMISLPSFEICFGCCLQLCSSGLQGEPTQSLNLVRDAIHRESIGVKRPHPHEGEGCIPGLASVQAPPKNRAFVAKQHPRSRPHECLGAHRISLETVMSQGQTRLKRR